MFHSLLNKLFNHSKNQYKTVRKIDSIYSDSELAQLLPNVLCIKNESGQWLLANDTFCMLLGLENVDYLGMNDNELIKYSKSNHEILALNNKIELEVKQKKYTSTDTSIVTTEDNEDHELTLTAIPFFDTEKNITRIVICGEFPGNSKKFQDEFSLLHSMFTYSHLSFIIFDKNLNILKVNNAFIEMTGLTYHELYGENLSKINIGKESGLSHHILEEFKKYNFELWKGEIICPNKKTGAIVAKLEITRIINSENITTHYFATLIDITLQKKNEQRIIQIAHYDTLTNLPNRVLFMDRIAQSLSECKRHKKLLVVFFIDLDKFKEVNDSFGHDMGDLVLKEASERFLSITRKEDVVSRFSGDEFALFFICDKKMGQALYEATKIAKKINNSISRPFCINNKEITIGSSIGISIYPEHGDSVEELLKKADLAMYETKNRGRNNFQFYKDEFSEAVNNRLEIEQKLRKVIENEELKLFYQPQFTIHNNKIWGAEVLVRWFENNNGLERVISPEVFIPIAEDSGLIVEIGKWILKTSCKQLKIWMDKELPLKQISVNVSARQFMDSNFVNYISEVIKESGIEAENLELEITESMLVGDIKRIELQLQRIKKMGVKIALDDFGTGYSSLSYLKNFPIDVLKIDQSFVSEMSANSKDTKIASAIIDMGHTLEQKVIAEGVENEEQLMLLSNKRCDIVQGYFYCKPLSTNQMTEFLQTNQAKKLFQ